MGTLSRPADMTDLESILEKNTDIKYSERWHPTHVDRFESVFSRGDYDGMSKELRKNIIYSLQYLEFLQMEYEEIHWHDVIGKQIIKTYIIVAMSIVEGIFKHIVCLRGLQKQADWKEIDTPRHTNVFRDNNGIDKKYIITTQMKLVEPEDVQMDFEFLITKVQEKKLISLSGRSYPKLKALKRLRNKVHLHIAQNNDTDYLGINYHDYLVARYYLYAILTDKSFSPQEDSPIDFIKLSEEQSEKIAYMIIDNED